MSSKFSTLIGTLKDKLETILPVSKFLQQSGHTVKTSQIYTKTNLLKCTHNSKGMWENVTHSGFGSLRFNFE